MKLLTLTLISKVLVAGLLGTACVSASAADATTKPARPGDEVYAAKCTSCHDLGMGGAPKLSDKAAWTARLAEDKETIYRHAIKGIGSMPSRGTCSTCSDEDIKAAVDYMLTRVR